MPAPRATLFALAVLAAVPAARAADKPLREVIDSHVAAAWAKEKLTPAKPATDGEFLRRAYLDLCGSVPTYAETVAFLDSTDPGKRAKLIDTLLADPRFALHQADIWDMVLFGRNPPGFDTDKRDGFQAWLKGRFEKNVPYDVWARDILRAEGKTDEGGAMFFVQYRNQPEDATEAVTQTFLGVQLQCARCHDHPFEDWKQLDFYGVAAFLARLDVVTVGKKGQQNVLMVGEHDTGDIQFTGPAKDAVPGKKGEPVKPKFLLGQALTEPEAPKLTGRRPAFPANQPPPKPKFSRKDALADWVTDAKNPYFAKAIANRVWAQYLGRGLVHPVDNMSPANPASIPELLDTLAAEMVAHKFDLKWYVRELVNSKTYQLCSAGGTGEPMPKFYQHARSRPLSAEELAEAWRVTSGLAAVETPAKGNAPPSRFRPFDGYLVRYFGTPNTGTGDFAGGMHEHLYLNNGPLARTVGSVKGGLAEAVGDPKQPAAARVERLFLQALHRKPTPAEAAKFAAFLAGGNSVKDNPAADAVWVLLTSSEFRFNH